MNEDSSEHSQSTALRHFGRAAHPAHGRGLPGQPLGLRPGGLQVIGQDRAGCHDVDPDALIAIVQGGDLGQAYDPRLARDVRGEVGRPVQAGDGGHVHDRASAGPQHGRDLVLHAEEGAADVRGHAKVEFAGIDVRERRRQRAGAGVVERRIESAERGKGLIHQVAH